MFIAEDVFVPIRSLYIEYSNINADDIPDYLNKGRRKLKILVDALMEQIIENKIGKKPRNVLDARRLINLELKKTVIKSADRSVLSSLGGLLSYYDILSDKSYIDYSDELKEIMNDHLRGLLIILCRHPELQNNGQVIATRKIIEGKNESAKAK